MKVINLAILLSCLFNTIQAPCQENKRSYSDFEVKIKMKILIDAGVYYPSKELVSNYFNEKIPYKTLINEQLAQSFLFFQIKTHAYSTDTVFNNGKKYIKRQLFKGSKHGTDDYKIFACNINNGEVYILNQENITDLKLFYASIQFSYPNWKPIDKLRKKDIVDIHNFMSMPQVDFRAILIN